MKIYHIFLGVLIITSSCVSDDTLKDIESNQQNFTFKKSENELIKSNGEISESLHIYLQHLSFLTAEIIYEDATVLEEVQTYLEDSGRYTISTEAIFLEDSEVPLLRDKLIYILEFCGHPEIQCHRPGITTCGRGNENSLYQWDCQSSYFETSFYIDLVYNNHTELFFPDKLEYLAITKPELKTIASTSSPNLSLLRDNEGYRFVPDHLTAYYFNLEYPNHNQNWYNNPMRVNMDNSYLLAKESTVVARIAFDSSQINF